MNESHHNAVILAIKKGIDDAAASGVEVLGYPDSVDIDGVTVPFLPVEIHHADDNV